MITVYLVNGNKDKAKEMVDLYPVDKESASDLAILARMNMLVDNFDEGFTLLKDAWYKDKNEVKVFDVIAQITDYNKTDVLDRISKIEKKEPNELAYKMWLAKIYSMSKDSAEKADELIEKLENEDVGNINLMLIKANMYQNIGDGEKAKEVLDEVIKEEPKSCIGYHAAAWQAYNNKSYDQAFKDCVKSIIINKYYPDNYGFLIPEILIKQNKGEGAEPYFRTALYKEPYNYNIMVKIAEYYGNTTKDTSKALYYYDLASKMKPNDAEIYYNMALININNQRPDDAIELLKKCISIDGKSPKYHRAVGTVYLNKEKNEDALKEIRAAYAIDKNDILTLNNAGCYYISVEGDVSRGLTNLKAAYDGMNKETSQEDREIITENYNRIKDLSKEYNKRNGASLKVPDLKLFY
jgi:predicted Zn-dependent protease